MNRVLVLSPHPDDAEFGCGATMATLVGGCEAVVHLLITRSEYTKGGESLLDEFKKSNEILGVPVCIKGLMQHRYLSQTRQALLQHLIDVREQFHPDTVFMPCLDDIHQDHAAVAAEALRAFKHCDLLGYDILWNNIAFQSQAFFVIEEWALEKKIEAIMAYKSQERRHYFDPELIRAAARMRGAQAGVKYAESFSNYRRFIR